MMEENDDFMMDVVENEGKEITPVHYEKTTVLSAEQQKYEWPYFITYKPFVDDKGNPYDTVFSEYEKLPEFMKNHTLSMTMPFNINNYAEHLVSEDVSAVRKSMFIAPLFPFAIQTPTLAMVLSSVMSTSEIESSKKELEKLKSQFDKPETRELIGKLSRQLAVMETKSRASAGGIRWQCTTTSYEVMEYYRDILSCIQNTFWSAVDLAGKMEKLKAKADEAYRRGSAMALIHLNTAISENKQLQNWVDSIGKNKCLECWDDAKLEAMLGKEALSTFKKASEVWQCKFIDMMENQILKLMRVPEEQRPMFKTPLLPVPMDRVNLVTLQHAVNSAISRVVVLQDIYDYDKLELLKSRINIPDMRSGKIPALLEFASYVQWMERWCEKENEQQRQQDKCRANNNHLEIKVYRKDRPKSNESPYEQEESLAAQSHPKCEVETLD